MAGGGAAVRNWSSDTLWAVSLLLCTLADALRLLFLITIENIRLHSKQENG